MDTRTLLPTIEKLDFTLIKSRLRAEKRWSEKTVDAAELWYKRFLQLAVKYPGVTLVPTYQVDEFFHAHVLDTKRYAEDSHAVFGYMLHHTPTYGQVNLDVDFLETNRIYVNEFGESPLKCFGRRKQGNFRSCCMGNRTREDHSTPIV